MIKGNLDIGSHFSQNAVWHDLCSTLTYAASLILVFCDPALPFVNPFFSISIQNELCTMGFSTGHD